MSTALIILHIRHDVTGVNFLHYLTWIYTSKRMCLFQGISNYQAILIAAACLFVIVLYFAIVEFVEILEPAGHMKMCMRYT